MQLRLPWLKERLPLIALAGWDTLVVLGAYGLMHRLRIGNWWGHHWEALGFAMSWVCISYLIGRYSKENLQPPWRKPWRSQTLLVIVILLAGIQLHSWTFRILMEQTRYRGFLIPLVALVTIGSLAGQTFLKQKYIKKAKPWLIVATPSEREILQIELIDSTLSRLGNEEPAKFCNNQELTDVLASGQVAGVAISQTLLKQQRPNKSLITARQKGLNCCSVETWCEQTLQRLPPELFDPDELLVADGYQLQPGSTSWRLKRFGDILVSSTLLLLTAPIIAMAMALIKLEDGKAIFYQQQRTGLFGQPLSINKLRTMRMDAEREGVQWAQTSDPRITRIGWWLRRFRIDELPQLLSVLKGEMSLIGPRPERPELEVELESKIANYRLRHWLRPGLSGWAQVCFPYGSSVEDSRIKLSYDLYYLRNANILLDLLILIKTARLVATAKGASPRKKKRVE